MASMENTLERKLREYKETKEQIKALKERKLQILDDLEEARKSEPFFSLQYRSTKDPTVSPQEVGIFTTIEKAIQYEESLNKDLETFTYEIVEYPLHCTIRDSTMFFINRTPR